MEEDFHYRGAVGKLNFLEKSTRPDIAYATHQCAQFSQNPKQIHAEAVKRIVRYLKGTRDLGIILAPVAEKSFDCWVDADFCGLCNKDQAASDTMTSKSRTGYVITYAGCPLTWASKLQTLTTLSSTEAEYVALSTALRDQIPLIELMDEVIGHGIDIHHVPPKIHCKVFEDNSGAIEMARMPKIRPRTKHINNYYHHFREYVASGRITILAVNTKNQMADLLTKSLAEPLFLKHRFSIMGC